MIPLPANWNFPGCLSPPDAPLDWDRIVRRFAWVRALEGTPQDPIHHAEGDVLIHTRMVAEALIGLDSWHSLPPVERSILFASALLHDVAKPHVTRTEADGSITSRGHARLGERLARTLLWSGKGSIEPAPFACREAIARLVRHHGLPLWFLEKANPERTLIEASQTIRMDQLALLAEADARGRICADPQNLLDRISLFRSSCRELDCYEGPRPFADAHSRFVYFHREQGRLDYVAYDDTQCEVTLMSGLPGVGKDTWIQRNRPDMPVISLDRIRCELQVDPEDEQGTVVQTARDRAKTLLGQHRSFIWNATNVTRQVRAPLIDLFASYRARVRLVYLDAPLELILKRNRACPHPVPEPVIHRLMSKLEVPDPTEAHEVEWITT